MTMQAIAGIPEKITFDFARQWLRPRLSEKRYRHVEGVVDTARLLAGRAACNLFMAELSAWLHDACKEIKDAGLIELAEKFQIPLDEITCRQAHLLHGPVAAATVKAELGIENQEVLDAIAEHTLGACPMSPLSKVLFLSDCLEESRPRSYTDPIWSALDVTGKFDMDSAIVAASDLSLMHLIESKRPIHPMTVSVRNYYLDLLKRRSSSP